MRVLRRAEVLVVQETYLDRIKKIKSERKITNEKLSDMTGIPLGTLSKLLAGISDSPKLVNIVAICRALDCSLDYIITGEPENTHNYTLAAEEIQWVETYRMLDDYGRSLIAVVMEKERDRTARQSAEEALLLRNMAEQKRASRRVGTRRAEQETLASDRVVESVSKQSEAYRYHFLTTPGAATNLSSAESGVPATGGSAPVVERSIVRGGLSTGLERRRISLYDLPVSAGVGEFLSESTRSEIMIPDTPKTQEADFALRIAGDSMEPKYHSGDVLLVENCEYVEEGELGIFVLDGSGYFKKYGGDCLISLNDAYAPIMLKDFNQVVCCGRVVGKLKRK